MKAFDTNVLVYARVAGSSRHAAARRCLSETAEGAAAWAIPWPCIYEFLRVVTHSRVYHPPMPAELALESIEALMASPSLLLLSETNLHSDLLQKVVRQAGAFGNLMHDAHIVALCLEHGVTELVTGDRDFSRFSGLKITNPFA